MERLEDQIFRDESLSPWQFVSKPRLPPVLRKARKLERGGWKSRQEIFLEQGRLLADYEDDYEYEGDPFRYYPTYQSLTDAELRGYFSWRTRLRRGQDVGCHISFLFLYVYELINNMGVASPQEGYERLLAVRNAYGHMESSLQDDLDLWLRDYVIYYDLPLELIGDNPDIVDHQCLETLENMETEPADRVVEAVAHLAPKWLQRSRFYAGHFEDMNEVIYRMLRKIGSHYAKGYKRNFMEQYFGRTLEDHVYLFRSAVFCNPLGRYSYEYRIDSQYSYQCEDGFWYVRQRPVSRRGRRKLEDLLKSIDSEMREALNYGHPIRSEISTKWILKLIHEEVQAWLAEKEEKARKKLSIDFLRLDRIRSDALITQDRLVTEEDTEVASQKVPAVGQKPAPASVAPDLDPSELRLLRCLLHDQDLDWIRQEGQIISVLIDGINEKLYDVFEDSVLDDSPQILEDYMDRLKEMFLL